jgi:ribosomal subunit interface protein
MTLRVSGKNLAIGEALRTHVHSRIDGVTAKYHAGSPTGHVTIEPEGSGYRADCTLFLKSGITLQVEAIAQEPYMSFDKAADRIERRLRDHKKRLSSRHGDGHAGVLAASEGEAIGLPPLSVLEADVDDGDGEETFPAVVAEHGNGFKEMTVAAAVRELDSSSNAVVVFRYAENRRINIVYRRADGNIGWIDPMALNGPSA